MITDMGSPSSQAAQAKEELQREGDTLDSKIRKAEKEIQALENTRDLMNAKNESYRKSLSKMDPSSEPWNTLVLPSHHCMLVLFTGDEAGELELLEGQWRAVSEKFRHKKKHAQQVEADLQVRVER